MLSLRMQMLSQQIASVFLPVIERVMDKLEQAVNWFRGLSGAQQDSILKWTALVAAGLAMASILPRVFGALQLVIGGVRALTAAMMALSMTPAGLLLAVAGLAVAVGGMTLAWQMSKDAADDFFETGEVKAKSFTDRMRELADATIYAGVSFGERHKRELEEAARALREQEERAKSRRRDVTPAAGAIESIERTYARIAEKTRMIGGGKDPQEQIAENTAKTWQAVQELLNWARSYRPVVDQG
jgi:hypothetical protein